MTGELFLFPSARASDPAVAAWFGDADPLRYLAQRWYDRIKACGPDVRELMHDGHPTLCLEDAASTYVAAFTSHAAIGFYQGASLADQAGLLDGSGKRMRHVKLRWGEAIDEAALEALIDQAYAMMRASLDACQTSAR